MAVHYVGDNGPDGVCVGVDATEKIAFHGADPVAQQTVTAVATGATAATIVLTLQALQAALATLGLVANE